MAKKAIRILVDSITPRLSYTCDVVFGDLLGYVPKLVLEGDSDLQYGRSGGQNAIPCDGLLYKEGIEKEVPESDDPLSKIFRCLSQYDLYGSHNYDKHGRHQYSSFGFQVHVELERIQKIITNIPGLPAPISPKFDFEITIDVDQPWKHRHKPFLVRYGGLAKSIFAGGFSERWKALFQGQDPFDCLEVIKGICPANKTTVFFLVDGNHPNDSRFSLRMPAYQDMVREYAQAGFSIGIHPSYETFLDAEKIRDEKEMLENVCASIVRSRQHYLRYRLPETFRHLIAAGVREEYSICPYDQCGAATGIARPFLWYDLENEKCTDLRLTPAFVMDRSLLQYMKMSPEEAEREIRKWIDEVREVNGKFVMILHNETFSESGEWKGWRKVIENSVSYLRDLAGK